MSMTLSDVMKLLQIDKFPDPPLTESEERFLVEATEELVKEHGEDWVRRHRGLLLDQWEYIRSL